MTNVPIYPLERIFEIGMHGEASFGGVDRYFWGLHDALRAGKERLATTAYYFGEGKDSLDLDGCVGLGSPKLPLRRRFSALRNAVLPGLRSGADPFSANKPIPRGTLLTSHFALYALPLLPELGVVPLVVHFHGPWAQESDTKGQGRVQITAKKAVELLVYRRASAFITLSHAFQQLLIDDYRVVPEKIHVIPAGVDLERFCPGDRRAARALLGWPQDRTVLLCVRRLASRMGLENLILGFSRIAARHPQTDLVIGGRGPLRPKLEALAASVGLQHRIRLAGFIPEEHLSAAYQAANACIMPSERLEGFGITCIESLACGTPVLVTPVGGLPEIMQPLARSCVLPGRGETDIAWGLNALLTGELPVPHPIACRSYAKQQFSWSRVAGEAVKVYRQATKGITDATGKRPQPRKKG